MKRAALLTLVTVASITLSACDAQTPPSSDSHSAGAVESSAPAAEKHAATYDPHLVPAKGGASVAIHVGK